MLRKKEIPYGPTEDVQIRTLKAAVEAHQLARLLCQLPFHVL